MIKELIIHPPKPFEECHASTIVEQRDGGYFAAWFGGSREGCDDVAIWGARKTGEHWVHPIMLAKVANIPHWNPVLFRGSGDELFLFFKVGKNSKHWRTWVTSSFDDATTWSTPKQLVPGCVGRGPVKNKCIELADGTWLAPASSEVGWWQAFVDRSDDKGKSWRKTPFAPMPKTFIDRGGKAGKTPFHVIQPTLWESRPNHAHMLLRSTIGKICRSDSRDGGKTWSEVHEICLPNNNSGIDLTKLLDGRLLLAFNPNSDNWGDRWPLRLALSEDNGETWKTIVDLESEPGKEYSYPAVIATRDGGAAITYTYGRKNIGFAKMDAKDLQPGGV